MCKSEHAIFGIGNLTQDSKMGSEKTENIDKVSLFYRKSGMVFLVLSVLAIPVGFFAVISHDIDKYTLPIFEVSILMMYYLGPVILLLSGVVLLFVSKTELSNFRNLIGLFIFLLPVVWLLSCIIFGP